MSLILHQWTEGVLRTNCVALTDTQTTEGSEALLTSLGGCFSHAMEVVNACRTNGGCYLTHDGITHEFINLDHVTEDHQQ